MFCKAGKWNVLKGIRAPRWASEHDANGPVTAVFAALQYRCAPYCFRAFVAELSVLQDAYLASARCRGWQGKLGRFYMKPSSSMRSAALLDCRLPLFMASAGTQPRGPASSQNHLSGGAVPDPRHSREPGSWRLLKLHPRNGERHRAGIRDVEALDRARHIDSRQHVAIFARETAQALAFSAQHQSQWTRERLLLE